MAIGRADSELVVIGEGALIVEQQAVFRPTRDQMQTVADAPQKTPAVVEPLALL